MDAGPSSQGTSGMSIRQSDKAYAKPSAVEVGYHDPTPLPRYRLRSSSMAVRKMEGWRYFHLDIDQFRLANRRKGSHRLTRGDL